MAEKARATELPLFRSKQVGEREAFPTGFTMKYTTEEKRKRDKEMRRL